MHRILLAFLAATLLLMNFSAAALAQTSNCSALVVDDAGVLGSRLNDVLSKARDLQNHSQGTVRILIAKDTGQNPAAYRQNQLEKQCNKDWGDGSGKFGVDAQGVDHVRNDLLAIIVGDADLSEEIFAGPKFQAKLPKTELQNIGKTIFEPKLAGYKPKSGTAYSAQMSDAITSAMAQMDTDINPPAPAKPAAVATAKPAAPVATAKPAAAQSAPAQAAPSKPADLTWLWILIAVVVVVGGGFFIVRSILNSRREAAAAAATDAARRQADQQAFDDAKLAATRKINGLDDRAERLKKRALALQGKVPADVYQRLQTKVTAATGQADDVVSNYSSYRDSTSVSAWNGLSSAADEAVRLLREAETACETLENDPTATLTSSTPVPPPAPPPAPAPAPPPAPAPVQQTVAPPPPPVQVATVSVSSSSNSSYDDERRAANDKYDDALRQVSRTERFILENSRFIRESTWGYLDDSKEELGRADRASTPHSRLDHSRKATNAAREALERAESDVQRRDDQTRNRWYYDRYHSGYTPLADNSTLVIYEPVYVPQQTVFVRDEPRYVESSSRRGSDYSGGFGQREETVTERRGSDYVGGFGQQDDSAKSGGSDYVGGFGSNNDDDSNQVAAPAAPDPDPAPSSSDGSDYSGGFGDSNPDQ